MHQYALLGSNQIENSDESDSAMAFGGSLLDAEEGGMVWVEEHIYNLSRIDFTAA